MASLDKNLFVKFNHLTDDPNGSSTILGASQKAVNAGLASIGNYTIQTNNGLIGGGEINTNPTIEVDATVLRTGTNPQTKSGSLNVLGNMTMNSATISNDLNLKGTLTNGNVPWARLSNYPSLVAGDGLNGGGVTSSNVSFSVDTSVVRTSRKITTGSGLQGGGDLSNNRSLAVDASVLRTGAESQTKSGDMILNGITQIKTLTGERATFSSNVDVEGRVDMKDVVVVGSIEPDPEAKLHVDGNVMVEGTVLAKEDVLLESDRRIKDDIERIANPFELLKDVNGYTYHLKRDTSKNRHMGLIAQEVQETMPEVVRTNVWGTLSVAYGNIVGVLVEAVKELRSEVTQNKNEIADLKAAIAKS